MVYMERGTVRLTPATPLRAGWKAPNAGATDAPRNCQTTPAKLQAAKRQRTDGKKTSSGEQEVFLNGCGPKDADHLRRQSSNLRRKTNPIEWKEAQSEGGIVDFKARNPKQTRSSKDNILVYGWNPDNEDKSFHRPEVGVKPQSHSRVVHGVKLHTESKPTVPAHLQWFPTDAEDSAFYAKRLKPHQDGSVATRLDYDRPLPQDIEGSRPAIAKFKKWNQRIMPDPYPGQPAAPRTLSSHDQTTNKEWSRKSPLYVTEADLGEMQNPHRHQLQRQHPYYHKPCPGKNQLPEAKTTGAVSPLGQVLVKERQVYVNGRYTHLKENVPATARCLRAVTPEKPKSGGTEKSHKSSAFTAPPIIDFAGIRNTQATTSSRHGPQELEGGVPLTYFGRLQAKKQRSRSNSPSTSTNVTPTRAKAPGGLRHRDPNMMVGGDSCLERCSGVRRKGTLASSGSSARACGVFADIPSKKGRVTAFSGTIGPEAIHGAGLATAAHIDTVFPCTPLQLDESPPATPRHATPIKPEDSPSSWNHHPSRGSSSLGVSSSRRRCASPGATISQLAGLTTAGVGTNTELQTRCGRRSSSVTSHSPSTPSGFSRRATNDISDIPGASPRRYGTPRRSESAGGAPATSRSGWW